MKRVPGILALALAGCLASPGGPAFPTGSPKASPGVRLVNHSETVTNGERTGLDLAWDLGGRPLREVRYGGMVVSGDPSTHPKVSTLKASFRSANGKTTLKVELHETEDHGSGTSSTTGDVVVDGGLGRVEVVPVDPAGRDKAVTLLRWKENGRGAALAVAFR